MVIGPTKLDFVSIEKVSDWASCWDDLILKSSETWYRHLRLLMSYTKIALSNKNPLDLSFFIVEKEKIIGLAPVLVSEVKTKSGYKYLEAGYYGIPLPWPCFVDDFSASLEVELEVFSEIERRVRAAGVGRIQFVLSPPAQYSLDPKRFETLLRSRQYLCSSYPSHWIELKEDYLTKVRPRYVRYVKKFQNDYKISVLEGKTIDDSFVDTYMDIHVRDSGGKFRSRDSYIALVEMARAGFAFFCVATCVRTNKIVGVLLTVVFKGQAYDGSVAIEPDYQDKFVSHVLKWKTIETLIERKVTDYELGIKAELPRFERLPENKNYGISFFKDGWSRGNEKQILVAEKFFDTKVLRSFLKSRQALLENFFNL